MGTQVLCLGVVTLDCGCVTPGSGSGRGCHHGNCGPVTPDIGSGRGSPWRLWTCEPRCRVWEVGSLLGLLTGYPRCMVWERVTL